MDRRRKYAHLMHLIETESGLGMRHALRDLDVLHMLDHTPPPRAARCPSAVTLHEFYDWVRQGWAVYRALCRRMARATEVVAVSAAVAEDYAARHARPGHVKVRVRAEDGVATVTVQDDGKGFDPAAALRAGRSRGLVGMRERAELLGGELRIDSAPGQGTTVTAVIPLG